VNALSYILSAILLSFLLVCIIAAFNIHGSKKKARAPELDNVIFRRNRDRR